MKSKNYSLGVSLSEDQYLWLKEYATMRTVSISAALRLLIDDYRKPKNYLEFMKNRLQEEK